jgi:CPA1 family monovalent cation:H+ antiporter
MHALELILLLLAVSTALRMLADRLGVPYAALLVVGGLLLAITPGLPRPQLSPDVLFLVFVPPLIYWGAASFALRDLRRELGPIMRLAIVMPIVSIAAVAATAHAMDPVFTWPAAFTVGAIVSFPDPVAVLSVLRSRGITRSIESILEGEGLFNDAVGIIAYRFAVAAAVTNAFSPRSALIRFLLGATGGVAIGIGMGYVAEYAHRLTRRISVVGNTISLLTPFASYLAAEAVGASGVVAVVLTGMHLARARPDVTSPETRLERDAMWNVVTFLLESLIFILVGLELPAVTQALQTYPRGMIIREAALIVLCVILVRLIWVVPSAYVGRWIGKNLLGTTTPVAPFAQIIFVGWVGLRGGDSVVIALALPETTAAGLPFPAREQILFIVFAVTFVTLVVQGPTLRPLARLLRLRGDRREPEEEVHARLAAAEAALGVLNSPDAKASARPEVVRYLAQRQKQRARLWATREAALKDSGAMAPDLRHDHKTVVAARDVGKIDDERVDEYRRLRQKMIDAEHDALVDMRDRDEIPDDVMRRVQRDLDFEALLLDTRQPVAPHPQDVPGELDKK